MSDEHIPYITHENLFSLGVLETRYPFFPYPEKECLYCSKNMELVKTIHIKDYPFEYKAIFVCYNATCEAYDEAAHKAYVKVYYSSELAASRLDSIKVESAVFIPNKDQIDAR